MHKKVDWLLVISVVALSLLGLIMIYSASYIWSEYKFNSPYKFVRNQSIFFVIILFFNFLGIELTILFIINTQKRFYFYVSSY